MKRDARGRKPIESYCDSPCIPKLDFRFCFPPSRRSPNMLQSGMRGGKEGKGIELKALLLHLLSFSFFGDYWMSFWGGKGRGKGEGWWEREWEYAFWGKRGDLERKRGVGIL